MGEEKTKQEPLRAVESQKVIEGCISFWTSVTPAYYEFISFLVDHRPGAKGTHICPVSGVTGSVLTAFWHDFQYQREALRGRDRP